MNARDTTTEQRLVRPKIKPFRLLVSWLVAAAALFIAAWIVPHVAIQTFLGAVVVSLVIAVLNALIPPLVAAIKLPLTLVLGFLIILVLDALMLLAASALTEDAIEVDSFWWALLTALIASAVTVVLDVIFGTNDDDTYTLRVVLHVPPLARCEFALGVQVQVAVVVVCAQPVAEGEHSPDLLAALGEGVDVHVRVGAFEEPVLVPVGLSDSQRVAGALELGHVGVLVGRVGHHQDDVDQRLRREARHRRRPDMFDLHGLRTQRCPDPGRLALEKSRPLRVVLGELDRRVVLGEITDGRRAYLVIRERHAGTLSRWHVRSRSLREAEVRRT